MIPKKIKIMIMIFLFLFEITKQYKCIVKENTYFSWGNSFYDENITVLTIRTPISNGYSSITFHDNPKNFKNSITFFSNTTTKNLKILTGDVLTRNFTRNETSVFGLLGYYINYSEQGNDFFGFQRYYVTIYFNNTNFIQNRKYVTIRYQENIVQNEYFMDFNFFKEFNCFLVYVDNLDFIHPSMTVLKG
jgi:hypothetical protein